MGVKFVLSKETCQDCQFFRMESCICVANVITRVGPDSVTCEYFRTKWLVIPDQFIEAMRMYEYAD